MSLGNRFSQHSFSQVPQANISRSKFDRSFAAKDTMFFDQLTPFFLDEILPGDTCNLTVNHFIRLATQVVPVMDNMYLDFFFFFVPNRLVWENWERFNGAQDDPGDSTDYLIPVVNHYQVKVEVGSIYDHYGIPTDVEPNPGVDLEHSALPFRGYNLIWNEWFRDQNSENSIPVPKGDGPDTVGTYTMAHFSKKHDYFTSALPWPQKGDAVTLSISGDAPVLREENAPGWFAYENGTETKVLNGDMDTGASGNVRANATHVSLDPNGGLYADLSEASAVTINQLRLAIMTQSLLELDARGGTRYVEILKSHFNVISPDFRLQRPEFLSSATVRLNQHPVAQTSETGDTPQANLAAYTTSSNMGRNVGFTKSFVEHGYVHGLVRARADVTYQQGLNRMWSRQTRYDFFWPKLQELGEQTILMKELFWGVNSGFNEMVYGYQERYAEYRYYPSQIRGQFRSTFDESLDVWTLAEEFLTYPALNSGFLRSNTPIERVLAVPDGYPHLLCDFWFDYKHARPMVTYAIPASLGRF